MKLKTRPYVTLATIQRWCDVLEHLDGKRIADVSAALYISQSSVLRRIAFMERYIGDSIATRPPVGTQFKSWKLTPLGRKVLKDNRKVICTDCGNERKSSSKFPLCHNCQIKRSNASRYVAAQPVPDGYISTKEAAQLLDRHHTTVSGYVREGRHAIKAQKIHGKWYMNRDAIEAMVLR